MTKNPLIKLVKENDFVFFEINGFSSSAKQICRVYNLKFQPADDEFDFDWLEFDADVLYTNSRSHPTLNNDSIGNCLAIKEIVPEPIVEMFAKSQNMWKATEYMLSDAELHAMRQNIHNQLEEDNKFSSRKTK